MATMINFNEFNGQKAVEKAIRNDMQTAYYNFCVERYGAENVSITEKGVTVARGTKTLSDGTEGEVCCTVMFKAENYDDRVTTSGKILKAFERITAAEDYEYTLMERQEKEEAKKRKVQERYKKMQEYKAEKLRAKLAAIENSISAVE